MTKRHSPSADRNKGPILEVLRTVLPDTGLVLEVASGPGQHAAFFADVFAGLLWQPTDVDPEAIASIEAYRKDSALDNLLAPVVLDVEKPWPIDRADAVLCINMIHISPWSCSVALFQGAARILPAGAPLITYGPYRIDGQHTAPSNAAFEARLQSREPSWAVRDIGALQEIATGFELEQRVAMPANNFTLIWRRL